MIIETFNISGVTQVSFAFHNDYIWIRNKSDASIYASHSSSVTAGASGTTEVPSGEAGMIMMPDNNTIYISGSGSVEVKASDFAECPFKAAGKGGGSGVAVRILGITTTALYDGATTNPIVVGGETVTARPGDLVGYGSKEFLMNINEVWDESGDLTNVYSKSETDALLNSKADVSTTYTKSETDTLLSAKANSSDVYTKTQADNLFVMQEDIDIKETPTTSEINVAIADIWGA